MYVYIYIYSCVVISIHIQERITHGGAKKELLHYLTRWDLAWPRVTKVVDIGLHARSLGSGQCVQACSAHS